MVLKALPELLAEGRAAREADSFAAAGNDSKKSDGKNEHPRKCHRQVLSHLHRKEPGCDFPSPSIAINAVLHQPGDFSDLRILALKRAWASFGVLSRVPLGTLLAALSLGIPGRGADDAETVPSTPRVTSTSHRPPFGLFIRVQVENTFE